MKEVLVHTPSITSLFYAILHPESALFSDYCDIYDAVEEHKGFIRYMKSLGSVVFTVRDVMVQGTMVNGKINEGKDLENLRNLAKKFITVVGGEDGKVGSKETEEYFAKLHPLILVDIVLNRPKITISRVDCNTGFDASYETESLTNLYFTRDQCISTKYGVVLGRMSSSQREYEVEVCKYVYNKLGVNIVYQIQEPGRMEGGDFMCTSSIAFIGCGMRTNYEAIKQLMDNDHFCSKTVAVVKDQLHWQNQMHLDTYFNIIAKYKVVLAESRLRHKGKLQQCFVDEWTQVYEEDTHSYKYVCKQQNVDFEKYLHDSKMVIIEVNNDDEMNLGTNFLTVKENHIACAEGMSEDFKRKMREHFVKVDYVNVNNLKKGMGSLHCMTQVFCRNPYRDNLKPKL